MIPEGAFILCNFPFGQPAEARARPPALPHIAYYLGREVGSVMLAYTSSGSWRGASPTRPLGIVEFNEAEAAKLNQRPFHIDLRCLARVELSVAWFPKWGEPGRGIVAVADAAVRSRILKAAEMLVRSSPEIIEIRGVARQTGPTGRAGRLPSGN